jgi:disulfide bond formation protein DsbB
VSVKSASFTLQEYRSPCPCVLCVTMRVPVDMGV